MKNKGLFCGIDVLYNFISPVTGRLPLINNYILIGAADNFSVMSPKLIDMQLDIINIRHYIDNIANSSFIIGFPNNDLPKAQVLSDLDNGFLFNTNGIISTEGGIPIPSLAYKNIWIGDENNKPVASPNILRSNLPSLTQKNIWIGDTENKPVEVQLNFAPADATYIIQTANSDLPNAQALGDLAGGILKSAAITGEISIAIPGEDYATSEQLREYAEQAAASAEEAATSAGEAAASAGEATASATEATGAAAEASVSAGAAAASALAAGLSAGSASSSASDASSSASDASDSASSASGSATNAANSAASAQTYLNTLLNTGLTLQGDVTGSGLLSNPILTFFRPNPVFTGSGSMTMPAGNSTQRPTTLIPGMIRFNTSL